MLDSFSNACIFHKILTNNTCIYRKKLPKFKLIKSYLRLTMSQKKKSGLVILPIEMKI